VVSFSRIGSSVNFIVTPTLAKSSNPAEPHVPLAVWFGTLMCVLSLISCITAGLMDYIGRDRVHVAEKNPDDEKPSLTHVRFFPLPAWNLMLITMIFYIAVLVFYQVASDIMQNTGVHKYSATTASYFLAIPNIVSIFASPTFGFIIDKFGRALWFVFFASLALVIGHLGFLGNALMVCDLPPMMFAVE
jgi:Na+/melibiose symporter-like transporter